MAEISSIQNINDKLKDIPKLKEIIREFFYAAPLDNCTETLATALSLYLRGEPLRSADTEHKKYLNSLSVEDRKQYWIAFNARN